MPSDFEELVTSRLAELRQQIVTDYNAELFREVEEHSRQLTLEVVILRAENDQLREQLALPARPPCTVERKATKDMLHPPSPDVAASKPTPVPPSEFRHPAVVPLPPPIEPPGLVADTKAAMSKEIDPIGEEVDECDSLRSAYSLTMSQPGSLRSVNQQDADDLRSECSQVKVAKVASFRSVQASSFLPPQHTMSTKSMDSTATGRGPLWPHLEDSRAAVRQSGYGRNSTQIHEKMMENRVKGELEKLRLRAEDLNETLMMLYRVTHTRVNAAFAKIEEEWNNTCVQQDATRLWWDDAHDLGCTQMYGAAKWNSSDCGTEVGLQGDASSAAHVLGVTNQMEKQQDDEVMLSHPLSSPLRCAGDPGEGLDHMRLQTPSREAETSRSASIEEVFSGILESDSAESSACKKAPPAFTFERCRGQRSGSGGRVALSPGTAREEAHSTDGTSGGKEAVQGTDFVEEPPEVDIKTQDLPTRRATWAPHASGSLAWD